MKLPLKYSDLSTYVRKQVRLEYIKKQKDKCFFCTKELSKSPPAEITYKKINWDLFPPNFLKHPVHLQHDHTTGMTEGAVHALCNAYWWQYHGR